MATPQDEAARETKSTRVASMHQIFQGVNVIG
jgi:hypothetical protein